VAFVVVAVMTLVVIAVVMIVVVVVMMAPTEEGPATALAFVGTMVTCESGSR
jgi:hypothetical protein